VLRTLRLEGPVLRSRGRYKARSAMKKSPVQMGRDSFPIPPAELISQVAGCPISAELFLSAGANGRRSITETLARNGVAIDSMSAILEFGVGCGRVARHWNGLSAEVHRCDYNPALVEWCKANLPHVRAVTNRLDPPLPYPDEHFDLVYALSVFTHLTESQQLSWSAELRRVTRTGGYVLFTTHGPSFPHSDPSFATPEIANRLANGELLVFEPGHAGRNDCAALHPRAWVEANMLTGFELIEYVEQGAEMNGGQDIYLVKKV
jgi:SAM-dependent methyltransferase